MAGNDVVINIKANDQTGASFSGLSSALLGINQALQLVQAAAEMAKKAFDWTKEGAQFAQTEQSFNRLTESVGMGSETLDEWSKAASGTIDNATLMSGFLTLTAGTSKELTAAFAENNEKLLQIAKAANALNPALGDTAFMYESIAKGIKRASPMILDNLGILVKVGDANEALAQSLGKTVEELTAEEKQMAILNEVLRSGDTLINQLGGSIESTVDPWNRMTTAIKNMTNEMQKSMTQTSGFAGILNDITDGLDEGQVQLEIYNSKVEILDAALKAGIITEKEHAKALVKLSNTYQVLEADVGYYADMQAIAAANTNKFSKEILESEFALIGAADAFNNATYSGTNYSTALGDIYSRAVDLTGSQEEIIALQEEINALMEIEGGGYYDGVYMSAKDVETAIGDLQAEIEVLETKMSDGANQMILDMLMVEIAADNIVTGDEMDAYFDMAVQFGIVSAEAAQQAKDDFALAKAYIEGNPINVTANMTDFMSQMATIHNLEIAGFNIPVMMDVSWTEPPPPDNTYDPNNTPIDKPYMPVQNTYDPSNKPVLKPVKAAGGPVYAQSAAGGASALSGAYWVGEVGPELFIPSQDGRILSNSDSMAMTQRPNKGGDIYVTINTPVNLADETWVERKLAPMIQKQIREAAR